MNVDVIENLLRAQVELFYSRSLEHELSCLADDELSNSKELLSGELLVSVINLSGTVG